MRTPAHLLAAFLLALAACGGGGPAGSVTSYGTGTGTLQVQADLSTDSGIPNTSDQSQYSTDMTVQVWRIVAGVPVGASDAVPVLKVAGAQVPLVQLDPVGNPGVFTATEPGVASGTVSLDVDAGADYVHGVERSAPGLQLFTNPATPAENISVSAPFTATWSRPAQADWAQLQLGHFKSVVPDTGSYAFVPYALSNGVPITTAQTNQPCNLVRRNQVTIAGGAPGFTSSLQISIHQTLGSVVLAP